MMWRHLRAHYEPKWRFASRQFLYACLLDLQALKPGNVGLHADGHGKTSRDYRHSATAASELISHPGRTLGKRIRQAAGATFDVVGCNTNLGVLLLAAPLMGAHYRKGDGSLQERLEQELAETTVKDARDVYAAIRLMRPAGLGTVEQADVSEAPKISLRAAMALAAERDVIAAQYRDGYPIIWEQARPVWEELCRRWGDPRWAMTGCFLNILAHHPDSHIARIHGEAMAASVSDKIRPLSEEFCGAKAPQDYRKPLLELDASWKSTGISPGSTADLTLTGVLAARLDGWSEDSDMEVLLMGDNSQPMRGDRDNR